MFDGITIPSNDEYAATRRDVTDVITWVEACIRLVIVMDGIVFYVIVGSGQYR